MLLSVIVANFNNAGYLSECLRSILAQSFSDLEILVADDASTDASPNIIREFEKKWPGKVRGIFSPVNRGVARNRHDAILASGGDYLTTLDSDDYYYDTRKLERELALSQSHVRESGREIIAFSNTVAVGSKGDFICRLGTADNIRQGHVLEAFLIRSCHIPRDFLLSRNAYFAAGGYDFSLRVREDWDLKIRLATRYEFRYTEGDGTGYRRHGRGLSALSSASAAEWEKWLRQVFSKNIVLAAPERRMELSSRFEEFLKKRLAEMSAGQIAGEG